MYCITTERYYETDYPMNAVKFHKIVLQELLIMLKSHVTICLTKKENYDGNDILITHFGMYVQYSIRHFCF